MFVINRTQPDVPQVPMSESECPNGMCSRKPTGAAAETYGKPASGKLESAVFALG